MAQTTKSQIYNSIQQYIKAGFAVTPLCGKKPVLSDWVNTPWEMAVDVNQFQDNFGVVLREEDCIIDVDPRNFPRCTKFSPIRRLFDDAGLDHKYTNTFVVRTGGGGYHIYFKKPVDAPIVSQLKEYPGVEFKTKGKQVVGAGCVHPDTKKSYNISEGNIHQIRGIPETLLDIIRRVDVPRETSKLDEYDDSQATQARYIAYLKEAKPAVEGAGGDHQTFVVACYGKELGISSYATSNLMHEHYNPRCTPPWEYGELSIKVYNAYKYAQQPMGSKNPQNDFTSVVAEAENIKLWDCYQSGQKKVTLKNTVYTFTNSESTDLNNLLHHNQFTGDISFVREAPWHTEKIPEKGLLWDYTIDTAMYQYYIAEKLNFEPKDLHTEKAIINVSAANSSHPVKAYLNGLTWDGKKRLDTWLCDYLGADDTNYVRQIGAKTLVAAVARIYKPGIKFDHMLVLEGDQGLGKSQAVKALGGAWYGDITVDAHNRDTIDAMRGKWVIEISEMECTRRTETQALKAFISRETDRVRLAYARASKDFHRQCIFIGTINPEGENDYLKDTTGNRRFWPVLLHQINVPALTAARDQLWAEAVARFRGGETLYIKDANVLAQASEEQRKRTHRDPWSDKIRKWLDGREEGTVYRTVTTGAEIYEDCLGGLIKNFARREQTRISTILQTELNWEKGAFYDNRKGISVAGYRRKEGINDL